MNKKLLALIACFSIAGVGSYMYGQSYAVLRTRVYDKIAELKKAGKSGEEAGKALYDSYKALADLIVKRKIEYGSADAIQKLNARIAKDLGEAALKEVETLTPDPYANVMKQGEKPKTIPTKTVVKAPVTKAPSAEDLKKLGTWATIDPSTKIGYDVSFNDDGDGLLEVAFDELEGKSKLYKTHLLEQYKKALQYAENIKKDATAVTSIKGNIEELEK